MKRENILITGGAGFIGSTLAEHLLMIGYKVSIVDSLLNPKNLNGIRRYVEYHRCDVRESNALNRIIKRGRFDHIVHLAAVSRVIDGEMNPRDCIETNVGGTINLLNSARKMKCPPNIIFGSSREVYGEPEKLPVVEQAEYKPMNVYGRTKVDGEVLVKEYAKECGKNCIALRFSNVYGNENDILDRVVPKYILSALRGKALEIHGGYQLFDFTHIDDTVKGIVQTIDLLANGGFRSGSNFEAVHLLPGIGTTLQELTNYISDEMRTPLDVVYGPPRTYDVERFVGHPEKAREVLGFETKVTPRVGVRATVQKFKEVMTA